MEGANSEFKQCLEYVGNLTLIHTHARVSRDSRKNNFHKFCGRIPYFRHVFHFLGSKPFDRCGRCRGAEAGGGVHVLERRDPWIRGVIALARDIGL